MATETDAKSAREEYLKKYLSGPAVEESKTKKKKKKKSVRPAAGMKIYEDDAFIAVAQESTGIPSDEDDREDLRREIILSTKIAEEVPKFKKGTFQSISEAAQGPRSAKAGRQRHDSSDEDDVPRRRRHDSSDEDAPSSSLQMNRVQAENDERVAHRSGRRASDSDESPRRRPKREEDGDISPPRRSSNLREVVGRPHGRRAEANDQSPPRRRRHVSSDESPPRKNRGSGSYESSSRRQRSPSDDRRQSKSRRREDEGRRGRNRSPDDRSPQRKRRREPSHSSPPRRRPNNGDLSPRNRRRHDSDGDASPPRRHNGPTERSSDGRSNRRDAAGDMSPPRRRETFRRGDERGRRRELTPEIVSVAKKEPTANEEEEEDAPRLEKTLDGKVAGLQSAKALREEMQKFKDSEKKVFDDLDESISGRNAATVQRAKLTGKNRETREEREKKEREATKQEELENKYAKWNKGVHQIDTRVEQLTEMARVAKEEFARHADNEAMNEHMKEMLLADDPMLEHVKKKKLKTQMETGIVYPTYKGGWPPNRFGIPPGYRWDGVDRSNGFEGKIALTANRKAAQQREYYENISKYE